jgi:hypothetical protein
MVLLSPFIICNNQGSARYLIFWHETPNTGTILEYNTGIFFYTSIVHNTSIPVLLSPSTGDPFSFPKRPQLLV